MDLKQRAKGLFATHPATNDFHMTSDGFGFFDLPQAEGHARSLEDKTVLTVTRAEVEKTPSEKTALDYSKANKTKLTEEAAKRGLDISEASTNAMIIEILKKDDEKEPETDPEEDQE